MKIYIIIPALNPDKHLLILVEQINYLGKDSYPIVIVDDGSNEESQRLFCRLEQEWGCIVLHHKENKGKGAALKSGLSYVAEMYPDNVGCVSADAYGEHSPKDILAIALAMEQNSSALILGTRDLSSKNAPFKSRWGNYISAWLFCQTTGKRCTDTQTGLRGIPSCFLNDFIQIHGDGFEYEMNVLFYATKNNIPIKSIPIKTIYRDNNRHSHFHSIRDSLRIYTGFFRYGISSLASAALDLSTFVLLITLLGKTQINIVAATVVARILSGIMNFLTNKIWVFKSKENSLLESVKYLFLFISQMLISALLVGILSAALPTTVAKILIDTLLFFASYFIQSRFIFKKNDQISNISSKGGCYMMRFFSKPFRWTILFALSLTITTSFVLLNTFVIPKTYKLAENVDSSSSSETAVNWIEIW